MDDSHYLPFSRVVAAPGGPAGAPVLGGQAPGSSLPEWDFCPSLSAVPRVCRTREQTLPASPASPTPSLTSAAQPGSQTCCCPSCLPRIRWASLPLPAPTHSVLVEMTS